VKILFAAFTRVGCGRSCHVLV